MDGPGHQVLYSRTVGRPNILGWLDAANKFPLRGSRDGQNCVTASVAHIRRSTKEALRG